MRAHTYVAVALALTLAAAGCGGDGPAATTTGTQTAADAAALADPAGDATPAGAPDVVGVRVARDATTITFRLTFAADPPLAVSEDEGWIDMVLVGIDVPPFGPKPVSPGGEWPGVDFALGTHGPADAGLLVRTGRGDGTTAGSARLPDVPLTRDGATLSFAVPRAALGDPPAVALSAAAAREWNDTAGEPSGATPDIVPDAGTWTVTFAP